MQRIRRQPGPRSGSSTSGSSSEALLETLADLRAEATRQRNTFRNETTASAIEYAVGQIETALSHEQDEVLTLAEASARSEYSEDHLGRLVRQRKIPDLRPPGYHGRILIRAVDLPIKPTRQHIPRADDTHSPAASSEAREA